MRKTTLILIACIANDECGDDIARAERRLHAVKPAADYVRAAEVRLAAAILTVLTPEQAP